MEVRTWDNLSKDERQTFIGVMESMWRTHHTVDDIANTLQLSVEDVGHILALYIMTEDEYWQAMDLLEGRSDT